MSCMLILVVVPGGTLRYWIMRWGQMYNVQSAAVFSGVRSMIQVCRCQLSNGSDNIARLRVLQGQGPGVFGLQKLLCDYQTS